MVVTFTITEGEDVGKTFTLAEGESKSIGRGSRAEFAVEDAGVSRMHCRLRLQDGACYVLDLGSRNGTLVNGVRVTDEVRLADDDVLSVGALVGVIHIKAGSEATSADAGDAAARAGESQDAAAKGRPAGEAKRLPPPIEPEQLIGMTIGGCRIEKLLGRDDISFNCLAMQVSMERLVVLKVLSPAMTADGEAVERFNAAARAGGKLGHPNIVRIYDAGEERSWRFIAMEHVGGKSVRELLSERGRNRPLELPQALAVAEQCAGALEYAHSVSVVHGHLTHDTVLVTPHGMAKLAEVGFGPSPDSLAETRPSSPEQAEDAQFIPPELLAGARRLTPQTDIYSLGVLLFLMAAGRMPFRGADANELLEKIRKGEHESARRLRRDAPESLEQLLDRALAPAPDRFRSAADMRAALLKCKAALG